MQLEQTDCCVCGVVFAVPKRILDQRREQGGNFFCPNGHSMVFTETEVDRLKKRLEATLARENEERRLRAAAEQQANNSKKLADDLAKRAELQRKRAQAGVCSCCNRTFANLARHMAAKHKDKA